MKLKRKTAAEQLEKFSSEIYQLRNSPKESSWLSLNNSRKMRSEKSKKNWPKLLKKI